MAPPPVAQVTCIVASDQGARQFVLEQQRGADPRPQWVLTLLDQASENQPARGVSIVLKGARPPVRQGDAVAFSYRSPHGGYIVELAPGPPVTLDVFVSHGLEVNVEPDLSPEVDRLNTDGKQPARCRVSPASQP
jgi:hypothetical protein